jgi:hypothetical protein
LINSLSVIIATLRRKDLRMVVFHLLFEIMKPILRARGRPVPGLGNCGLPIVLTCSLALVGCALLRLVHELLEIAFKGVRNRRVDLFEEFVGQLFGRFTARGLA